MTKLVRPQKISDQVLAVLEERIATGIYEEGSKLPPERTLAEEFGVSRPSVRVALNILIAKQVLEARQGDGYYVSVKPQQDFLQSWQELLGKHTIGKQTFSISAVTLKAVWRRWPPKDGLTPI